jgi:hypothetical protein
VASLLWTVVRDVCCPYGTDLVYFGTRHFVPGYLRIVPSSGQRLSTPAYEFDARSLQTERRRFEDEDDDEDEDEDRKPPTANR